MNITENQMGTMKVSLRIMNTPDKKFLLFSHCVSQNEEIINFY